MRDGTPIPSPLDALATQFLLQHSHALVAQANATSTSIALRWNRVEGADLYDLQCSGAGSQIFTRPFVSVGSPCTAATVESILPNTTLTCQVRAHRFATTGFYHHNTLVGDWSELSAANVECGTLAGDPPPPPAPAPPSNPGDGRKTQMVQMWRVSEYNYTTEEDYLQNHDSGDLNGDAAVLSAVGFVMPSNVVLDKCAKAIRHVCPGLKGQVCMQCFERWAMELQLANACNLQPNDNGGLPKTMLSIMQGCQSGFLFDMHTAVLTSYCVEVVADTPDCPTCTSPPNDGSEGYYGFAGSWSEYMSCNNGQQPQDSRCYCEGTADRQIGHQTTANVKSHCPNTQSLSTSEKERGQGRAGWLRGAYAQQLGLSGSRGARSLRRVLAPADQMPKPPKPSVPNRNNSDCGTSQSDSNVLAVPDELANLPQSAQSRRWKTHGSSQAATQSLYRGPGSRADQHRTTSHSATGSYSLVNHFKGVFKKVD